MQDQLLNDLTRIAKEMHDDPAKADDTESLAKLAAAVLTNEIRNLLVNYKHGFNGLMDDLHHIRTFERKAKENAAALAKSGAAAEDNQTALHKLCIQLYGSSEGCAFATLGDQNAPVLQDAVSIIQHLRTRVAQLEGMIADIP